MRDNEQLCGAFKVGTHIAPPFAQDLREQKRHFRRGALGREQKAAKVTFAMKSSAETARLNESEHRPLSHRWHGEESPWSSLALQCATGEAVGRLSSGKVGGRSTVTQGP